MIDFMIKILLETSVGVIIEFIMFILNLVN